MREIQLTQGFVTLIDDSDFEWLSQWKWHARKKRNLFYACRSVHVPGIGTTKIMMHRLIIGVTDRSIHVDHRNGNTLDNQRNNIRSGTHGQNLQNCTLRKHNTSGFIGVYKFRKQKGYYVKLKGVHIGCYDTAEKAARARDEVARKEFGEFGTYNFPLPGERPARVFTS